MRTVLWVRRKRMRRDQRRPGGRHAIRPTAPDARPADRSPPDLPPGFRPDPPGFPPDEQMTPTGVPHHADLFSLGDEPSPADVDEASFQALTEVHREALFGYVLRLVGGDDGQAQDIVKETFYRASQDPSRLVQRTSSVRPWLVLLARTVFQDGLRREPADAVGTRPAVPAATTVVRAMDSLSRVHREILIELFYRGTSLEEAAQAHAVPVDTVKSRLYYAMRALRVVLDQQVADRPDPAVPIRSEPDRRLL
jgi:RNA polymerase sigma-70 factor (ECF subfamily)